MNQKNSKTNSRSLLTDDHAQATTEYMVLLAIAISLFLLVYANFLKPFFTQFIGIVENTFQSWMFPVDFHTFPVHR